MQYKVNPHKPKPPSIMVAPLGMSFIASAAFVTTLFILFSFIRSVLLNVDFNQVVDTIYELH